VPVIEPAVIFVCFRIPENKKIAVFGDSLSDDGNVYQLTNRTYPPTPPYYQGRFTNGKVWLDYVRSKLGVKTFNGAYGTGSTDSSVVQGRTGPDLTIPTPGVVQQISKFIKNNSKKIFQETTFVVWAGGNDYFFSNFEQTPALVVNRIKKIASTLYKQGARDIIIGNLIPLNALPYVTTMNNQTFTAFVASTVVEHNRLLKQAVKNFANDHAGSIKLMDVYSTIQNILTRPSKFGIVNITSECLDESTEVEVPCSSPSTYFWWDLFHYTTGVHKQISLLAQSVLSQK